MLKGKSDFMEKEKQDVSFNNTLLSIAWKELNVDPMEQEESWTYLQGTP